MSVRVVTDSTSDLPRDVVEELGITVVPLSVTFDAEVFKDGVDLSPDEFYRKLAGAKNLPTTSQPSVGEFVETYRGLGQDADGIVSVHISSKVSGTFNAATQAADQAEPGCPIKVVDTLQASMAAGMAVITAARAAQEGAGFGEVSRIANEAVDRCHCVCLVSTLEYLRRGGRIGRAQALVGSLLKVHPLIELVEGEVFPVDRPRTRPRGVARLLDRVRGYAPLENLGVMYSTTRSEADELAASLSDLLGAGKKPLITQFGPVIGAYVGPGALGVGLLRAQHTA